jgi:hypothetical protein
VNRLEDAMNSRNISWGIQWIIASLMTRNKLKAEDVLFERLDRLKDLDSSRRQGSFVYRIIKGLEEKEDKHGN